ncbi:uncharacterized protein N7473_004754 [Penicillium subrubescens]|nr:uncharacterized protein N7473_004754 [Penicillium subrubescens]KAJ5900684.1 hypothetical protein N7473_004754 [Penicillium subrubescens]
MLTSQLKSRRMAHCPRKPRDYYTARTNIFSDTLVDSFVREHGTSPRFVYGPLVLPTVLKFSTGSSKTYPMEKYMTKAVLYGYELYQSGDKIIPVIARSRNPKAVVEGMLVFNLEESKRNAIFELESGLGHLEVVQAEIGCKPSGKRFIDAAAFLRAGSLDGLIPIKSTFWDPTAFVNSSFYHNIEQSVHRSAEDISGSWFHA